MNFKKILLFIILPLFLVSFAFASFIISDIVSSNEDNDSFNIVAFDTVDNNNFFSFDNSKVFDFFNTGFVDIDNNVVNNGSVIINFNINKDNLISVYPDNKKFIVSLDLINYSLDNNDPYYDFINSSSFNCTSKVLTSQSVNIVKSNSLLEFEFDLDSLNDFVFSIEFNFLYNDETNFNEFFRKNVFLNIFNTRFMLHALISVC